MEADYEAAIAVYLAGIDELDRLFRAGGSEDPSSKLKATTSGTYRQFQIDNLRLLKRRKWRTEGSTTVVGVFGSGWRTGDVSLTSCEDGSSVRLVDANGNDVTPKGTARYVQTLRVLERSGGWQMDSVESKPVKNFEGQTCGKS